MLKTKSDKKQGLVITQQNIDNGFKQQLDEMINKTSAALKTTNDPEVIELLNEKLIKLTNQKKSLA